MKKKYYSKFQIKDKTAKAELARAHAMIVLLVIALMATLTATSTFNVEFTPGLTFLAVALLSFVGIISLTVVVALIKKRK